jgi:hypothetical protein
MTFTDLYLKFKDEDEMRSVLFEQVPTEWDRSDPENPIATAWEERQLFRNTDIVGLIVDTPAELNEEGEVVNDATYVDGVHCNIRAVGEDTSSLESYRVDPEPNTPARVWA